MAVVHRAPSESAAARAWIENLPARSWFNSRGVPGARHVVRNVLSRLANAETPIIGRAAPRIYWRQPPPAADDYGALPVLTPCATSIFAPVGSGYASDCALSELGWSTQMPYRTTVAVPYRNLTPPECPLGPPLTFAYRSNQRRRELNWNEATLLEAALRSHLADYHNWDHAMWLLLESNGWMQRRFPIRRSQFLWAAETEPPPDGKAGSYQDSAFRSVMTQLASDMPESILAP